jgi:hypothetical protein
MAENWSIDDQFAALPDRVKASLIRVVDVAAESLRAGELGTASRFLDVARQANIPPEAPPLLAALAGVANALSLEEHARQLAWAEAEGFTGIEGFVVALGRGPFGCERSDEEANDG